ncbi:BQ5605_C029g10666 [Microbotryum silenes-dioicae]|uniref:BQ5605_C029g10666 protein n=1 Tax=Microbotryum silenes-dioicae TaxID=796604 RepID=A0A2X0MJE6_9BASI|nr:BQ5605_C029g10666 [Microbotryum silenes-dioicae]
MKRKRKKRNVLTTEGPPHSHFPLGRDKDKSTTAQPPRPSTLQVFAQSQQDAVKVPQNLPLGSPWPLKADFLPVAQATPFLGGAHKLLSFGLAGTATKRAKGGYKATTASSWVKVKPLRAKSAAQIKTRRAPNADSNGR